MSAQVRRHNALWVREQRMPVRQGFGVGYVDGGAEEAVGVERFQEFLCALACAKARGAGRGGRTGGNQSAAANVEEEGFGLEQGWGVR